MNVPRSKDARHHEPDAPETGNSPAIKVEGVMVEAGFLRNLIRENAELKRMIGERELEKRLENYENTL